MAIRSLSETESPSIDWPSLLFALLGIAVGGVGAVLLAQYPNLWVLIGLGLGVALLFATTHNPEIGLLVLVVMTYIRFSDVLIRHQGLPSTAQPFIAMLIVAIIVRWILDREHPSGWVSSMALVVMYGLVGLASLLYAHDYTRTFNAMSDYVKDATIAIIVTLLLGRFAKFRHVIWALLASGIFMTSITVFQFLTGAFENDFGGFGQARIQHIVGGVSDYRVSGPIGDPNFYAQILIVLVPLALERMANGHSNLARVFAAWALLGCALSIVFTFSRGGFLGLVVVVALMILRHPPRPLILLLLLAAFVVLIQFIPGKYVDRLTTIPGALPLVGGDVRTEISIRGRTSETAVAQMMFADHPILGVGLGNYPLLYQDYSRQLGLDPRSTQREPHDLYLEIAAETGILGLSVFAFLLWFMFRGMQKARKTFEHMNRPEWSAMVAAFEIGMIGYLTAALFLHLAYPRFFWLLFGIALALPQVAHNELTSWSSQRNPAPNEVSSDSRVAPVPA